MATKKDIAQLKESLLQVIETNKELTKQMKELREENKAMKKLTDTKQTRVEENKAKWVDMDKAGVVLVKQMTRVKNDLIDDGIKTDYFEGIKDMRDAVDKLWSDDAPGSAKAKDTVKIKTEPFTLTGCAIMMLKTPQIMAIKPFRCDVCQYASTRNEHLVIHKRIHCGQRPYKCDKCGYASKQRRNLASHYSRVHRAPANVRFLCGNCDYSTLCKSYLIRHMLIHSENVTNKYKSLIKRRRNCDSTFVSDPAPKRFLCGNCDYSTIRKSLLIKHMSTHCKAEAYLKCDYNASKKTRNLAVHHSTVQPSPAHKRFVCGNCDYSTILKRNLIRHMLVHSEDITSVSCYKGVSSKIVQKTVGKMKNYKCDACRYTTDHRRNFMSHQRTHTGERPFKCNRCKYAAKTPFNLKQHLLIHSGIKPFKCDACNYSCRRNDHLQIHKRIHSSNKPFKCDTCSYSCRQLSLLQIHKRTHTGERPFQCDKCEYKARTNGTLTKHKKSIHC